ncbi:MAG: AEC family transporter [Algoriphagus sp.]|jgi:predicted permease|nr:AEC family transporter [Algoriphagus sp.]
MGLWIAIFSLFCGLALQFLPAFPKEKVARLGKNYLIYLALPALALLHIPPLQLNWNLLLAPSSAWFTFLLSWVFFAFLGTRLGWDKRSTGCLILVSGLGNTSFLGFPILELLYGKEALPTAFLIDQGGSFLLVSTLGVYIGSRYGDGGRSVLQVFQKMMLFPPFLLLLATLVMSYFRLSLPDLILPWLQGIGTSMAPIAMAVIGLTLSLDRKWTQNKYLWYGLGYRLLLAPACVWLLYGLFLPSDSLTLKVFVLESGMAPMISGALLAMEFGLQPRLATLLAGLGIPLCGITLLLWQFLMG